MMLTDHLPRQRDTCLGRWWSRRPQRTLQILGAVLREGLDSGTRGPGDPGTQGPGLYSVLLTPRRRAWGLLQTQ